MAGDIITGSDFDSTLPPPDAAVRRVGCSSLALFVRRLQLLIWSCGIAPIRTPPSQSSANGNVLNRTHQP